MTNRVAVDRPVLVRSVNGPAVTLIQGYQVAGTVRGDGAIRCVYLTNGAVLSGFTLTNGATRNSVRDEEQCGGGVMCESLNALVTNCTLTGNSGAYGGGAHSGTLNNCRLAGNSAINTWGGGACNATLNNCSLTGNLAFNGGGTYASTLNNCSVVGNLTAGTSSLGGGACGGALNNCILYYNTASSGPNYYNGTLNCCCTTPLPAGGSGNITNEPLLMDRLNGNLRLLPSSPCIDAGNNYYVTTGTDLDGLPRILGARVDLGAYEYCTLADALDAPELAWSTSGSAAWFPQAATTQDGLYAAQSGAITNSQESSLQTTVTGPGRVSYWWKISSQPGADELQFLLDGQILAMISGEVVWEQRSFPVPAGSHMLLWSYRKDGSNAQGQDQGWLDEVSYLAAPVVRVPPSSQVVAVGANVAFSVGAAGPGPLAFQWRGDGQNLAPPSHGGPPGPGFFGKFHQE